MGMTNEDWKRAYNELKAKQDQKNERVAQLLNKAISNIYAKAEDMGNDGGFRIAHKAENEINSILSDEFSAIIARDSKV